MMVVIPGAVGAEHLLLDAADRAARGPRSVPRRSSRRRGARGGPLIALTIAVLIAVPALGPSLGIAPAGTCTCTSIEPEAVLGDLSVPACVGA
jgi:hypothetical protein